MTLARNHRRSFKTEIGSEKIHLLLIISLVLFVYLLAQMCKGFFITDDVVMTTVLFD